MTNQKISRLHRFFTLTQSLYLFRRSLELDKLKLGPEEGIVIAFVPNFDHKGDEAKEIVNAETAQE